MIATFLVLFAGIAACQAILAVKLADRLSPPVAADGGFVAPARLGNRVSHA